MDFSSFHGFSLLNKSQSWKWLEYPTNPFWLHLPHIPSPLTQGKCPMSQCCPCVAGEDPRQGLNSCCLFCWHAFFLPISFMSLWLFLICTWGLSWERSLARWSLSRRVRWGVSPGKQWGSLDKKIHKTWAREMAQWARGMAQHCHKSLRVCV